MNAKEFIEAAGGQAKVMQLTGLTRAGISNWRTQNYIPKHWIVFFKAKVPAIRKATLNLEADYPGKSKKTATSVQTLTKG